MAMTATTGFSDIVVSPIDGSKELQKRRVAISFVGLNEGNEQLEVDRCCQSKLPESDMDLSA